MLGLNITDTILQLKIWAKSVPSNSEKLTAIGAGLPGTITDHGWPASNEGNPSGGMLIPGNIRSAPPIT
jgi:hypothetical protein